jgi:hypothetical protein
MVGRRNVIASRLRGIELRDRLATSPLAVLHERSRVLMSFGPTNFGSFDDRLVQ